MGWERFVETVLGSLATAIPVLIAGVVGYALYWLRVRTAQLRAERERLPPSSEPPRPSWWQSLRPRLQSIRPRRRRRELEPDAPDPDVATELERRARDTRVGSVDDFDHEPTPPRGRRRS